jgi:hypothetical protein
MKSNTGSVTRGRRLKKLHVCAPTSPSWMRVACCSGSPAGAPAFLLAPRRSSLTTTRMTASPPWLPSPCRPSASIWACATGSRRRTARLWMWRTSGRPSWITARPCRAPLGPGLHSHESRHCGGVPSSSLAARGRVPSVCPSVQPRRAALERSQEPHCHWSTAGCAGALPPLARAYSPCQLRTAYTGLIHSGF